MSTGERADDSLARRRGSGALRLRGAEPRARRPRRRRDRLQLARPADPVGELLRGHGPDRRRGRPGCGSMSASSPSPNCPRRRVSTRSCRAIADRSELVRRIRATNVDERMPPESTHKTLSAQQMAILEQWIENGAEYRPHWAFIAPQRPAIPDSTSARRSAATRSIGSFSLASHAKA